MKAEPKTIMAWKCLNPECGRIFYLTGRISKEKKEIKQWAPSGDPERIIHESPCCPYCQSLEFKPIEVKVEPFKEGKANDS